MARSYRGPARSGRRPQRGRRPTLGEQVRERVPARSTSQDLNARRRAMMIQQLMARRQGMAPRVSAGMPAGPAPGSRFNMGIRRRDPLGRAPMRRPPVPMRRPPTGQVPQNRRNLRIR